VQALAPAKVVKYGILLFSAALLKDQESSIDFFSEVVLITRDIFLSFKYSTTCGLPCLTLFILVQLIPFWLSVSAVLQVP